MNEGILLVDKPKGATSFSLVRVLRRHLNIQKIGHAGTLDPMATGLMVMLIGKNFTRLSEQFLQASKEYESELTLGYATDSFDATGQITDQSAMIPTLNDVENAIACFQGHTEQLPPMFSAKKIKGEKLYNLARQGVTVERKKNVVWMHITLLSYAYPILRLHVTCSKGTYIRTLAHDLGEKLGSFATLTALRRLASGTFRIEQSFDGNQLFKEKGALTPLEVTSYLIRAHAIE